MSAERVFLGWRRPCLEATTEFLFDRYASGSEWDMRRVVVVTPGGRAGRRLLERLATFAAAGGPERSTGRYDAAPLPMVPPKLVTTGMLPEELYVPTRQVAEPLDSLLARTASLREARSATLGRVVANRPGDADISAWVALARELERVQSDVMGEGMSFSDVADCCRGLEYCDAARWEALQALYRDYLETLAGEGLCDRVEARREALRSGALKAEQDIILLSTLDLNRLTREMVLASGARVVALIHAPCDAAAGYGDLGQVEPEYWIEQRIPIPASGLQIVDRPGDQAYAALAAIAGMDGRFAADQITIGLGDASMGPLIGRFLELAALPARPATGRDARLSPPAMLLSAAAAYLEGERCEAFAGLLRHPDLAGCLRDGPVRERQAFAGTMHECPALLDRYLQAHLPFRLPATWLEGSLDPAALETLRAAQGAVASLFSPLRDQPRSLRDWSQPIADLLLELYGRRELRLEARADAQLAQALKVIGDHLGALQRTRARLSPSMAADGAMGFLLGELRRQALPEEGGAPAIELLGWLELQLDDAPALVVTGFNEGGIPESVNGDAFLPDRLRSALGLLDNRRRYARDAAMLRAILESRPHVTLIAGRRSDDGDPLTPSRLLFACDEDTMIRRALAFYGGEGEALVSPPPILLPAGSVSAFTVPRPSPPPAPIRSLRVTAFRDYLACPYRFYLRHVLRLEEIEIPGPEMDGPLFGSLAHDVLRSFGVSAARDSTSQAEIEQFLIEELERQAQRLLGAERSAALAIQLHQMRRRLRQFSAWQANHAAAGWRIDPDLAEAEARATLLAADGDHGPFLINGKIDRIDRNPATGQILLLDYKTGSTATKPDEAHRENREGVRVWIDLQLPLYLLLAGALDMDADDVSLGYVNLPKELPKVGLALAEWSAEELESAHQRAREVVVEIRNGHFWPPAEPGRRGQSGYSGICFDRYPGRGRLLREEAAR